MADPFTVDQLEAVSRDRARVRILIKIVAATPPATVGFTWRYCTGYYQNYDSEKYTPRGLLISGSGRGPASLARMTISIDNRDKALGEDVKAAVRTVGATCLVVLMTEDADGIYGNPVTLIDGWVVRISAGNDISIEASALYGQRREASLMMGSRNCGNAYVMDGSKLCQYSGGLTTCMRTEADCIAHHGDLEFYNGFLNSPSPGAIIPIGTERVKVPLSRTNPYNDGSSWVDKDSALKNPDGNASLTRDPGYASITRDEPGPIRRNLRD